MVLNSLGPPKYLPRPNAPCSHNTEHLRYAEACIFAAPNILGIEQSRKLQHPFTVQPEYGFFSPPRYNWIADPNLRCRKESQLIDILVEECGFLPTCVWINCESFMWGRAWQSKRFLPLLYKFLSNVCALRLTVALESRTLTADFFDIPSFILEAILWQNNGKLRSSAIDGDEHYVMEVFPSIVTLLGQFEGSLHAPSIQDMHHSRCETIPYGGLEELEVELDSIDHSNEERHFEFGSQLASILQQQNNLKDFSLWLWPLYSPKLVSSLSSLFHQPQFMSVSLETTVIPFTLFQRPFCHLLTTRS